MYSEGAADPAALPFQQQLEPGRVAAAGALRMDGRAVLQDDVVRRQVRGNLESCQPRGTLEIGLETLHQQAIEPSAIGLGAHPDATPDDPLQADDDLTRPLVAQPSTRVGRQVKILEALQVLVRRRLRLDGVAGPHLCPRQSRRQPGPAAARTFHS